LWSDTGDAPRLGQEFDFKIKLALSLDIVSRFLEKIGRFA
jgi:hypothetical protein